MANIPLRNIISLIQKRFLQTNPTPSSVSKPAFGLSKRLRISANAVPESRSLFGCLKSYGFGNTQIEKLVEKRPEIENCEVNTKIKPKLEYLIEKGFTCKLLPELIVSNPMILLRSFDSQIKPSFEFLSPFLNAEEMLVAIKRSSSWLRSFNLNSICNQVLIY